MNELRNRRHVLELERDVHVLGFRNQSELPEIDGATDVFVQASEREPWGMVVNEAMACGMAVCASDQVGSAYDLVKDNGAMFRAGDVEQLAALLSGWVANRDEIRRMKEASVRRIQDWGPQHTADGLVAALRATLGRGRHGDVDR